MLVRQSSPADDPEKSLRDENTLDALRVLDWTNLDGVPESTDAAGMAVAACRGGGGAARLAVLVNTPRMLRAANVFAEQAELQGAQVRVFVDEGEAQAWLDKRLPSAFFNGQRRSAT